MTDEQKRKLDIKVRTCKCCGNLMKPFFQGAVKTALYKEDGARTIYVCNDKCKEKWESQFFVEEYKGQKIYKVHDRYIPYFGAAYYFENIEDCRKRIDVGNKIAVAPFMSYC